MTLTAPEPRIAEIVDALRARNRFVLSSHARPDGDAIGSQLALAGALRHLGKEVRLVNHDAAPPYLSAFAGVEAIEVADAVDGPYDAAVIMECGSLDRTEVTGLDRGFVINVDHHAGNTMYGAINWFDESAAACGEMVFDLVEGLGVPLTEEIGAALYVAILTDTGAFHHGHITARTFEICRRIAEAGVSPAEMAAPRLSHIQCWQAPADRIGARRDAAGGRRTGGRAASRRSATRQDGMRARRHGGTDQHTAVGG